MSFFEDVLTIGIVGGLAYAAWIFQIKPELDRRKKAAEDAKATEPKTEK